MTEKKTVSQFLVWDYLESMIKINLFDTENFIKNSFRTACRKYEKYRFFLCLLDGFYNSFFLFSFAKRNNKQKKILFEVGNKYPLLVLAAKKFCSVEIIAKGKNDRLFAIRNLLKYTNYSDLNQFIDNYLTEKNEKYLYRMVDVIKKRIEVAKPDIIVLWNDSVPIERAIILASRDLGVKTVTIQHGIYSPLSLSTDGMAADKVLAWGQYFKDLHVEKSGRDPNDIYILGYPYSIKKNKTSSKKNKNYNVYYLGQNFETYNESLLDVKVKTIKDINKICVKMGMRFVYRPHPGDNLAILKKQLPDVNFCSKREGLEDSFKEGDVFISCSSTTLVEAMMRSKISLQLMNYPGARNNFEKLGVCNKTMETINELEDYLKKIAAAPNLGIFEPKFNNNYIDISRDPGRRFIEIINQI